MGGRRWLSLGWMVVVLMIATLARAGSPAPAEASRLVAVEVSGQAAESRSLLASVNELLGRLGLRVVSGPGVESAQLATVSVELGALVCIISVARPGGPVVQVRRVARGPSSAVTLEAVAHVIQSSVEELAELDRQTAIARAPLPVNGARPDDSPPLAQSPSVRAPIEPVGPAADGLGVELGAYLSGRSFANVAPVVLGAGMVSALRFPSWHGVNPRLAASFTWTGPFVVDAGIVRTSTQTLSMRLLAQVRFPLGARFALDAGLGGGADVFLSTSTSGLPIDQYAASLVVPSAILLASVGARARLSPFAEVFLTLAGDLDLSRHSYVSLVAGNRTVVFEHWQVRPALTLGFSFDLWEAK